MSFFQDIKPIFTSRKVRKLEKKLEKISLRRQKLLREATKLTHKKEELLGVEKSQYPNW
jgi:hypothetical protein